MCGRFTQTKSRKEALEALGDIELPPLFHGRYNIAPAQKAGVIRQGNPRHADEYTWGFDHSESTSPVINARSETLAERPMFRDLLSSHRCLIPADGFYEWKDKQPYYFQLPQKELFAFAGLWRNDRFVIITRAADASMQGIHHRMPIIFPVRNWNLWLGQFHLPDPAALTARPVSRRVNKVANDNPECLNIGPIQDELF